MRNDMHKVVIERPRIGHWKPSKKTRLRIHPNIYDPDSEYDNFPNRIASGRDRQYSYHSKEFSDFLNPLERFLRKSVGRPWNDVYSELCAGLDRRKTLGQHVFDHLWSYVEKDCYIDEDGEIYDIHGKLASSFRDRWYVHPVTGVLGFIPMYSIRQMYREKLPNRPIWKVKLSEELACEKRKGFWYFVRLELRRDANKKQYWAEKAHKRANNKEVVLIEQITQLPRLLVNFHSSDKSYPWLYVGEYPACWVKLSRELIHSLRKVKFLAPLFKKINIVFLKRG